MTDIYSRLPKDFQDKQQILDKYGNIWNMTNRLRHGCLKA